MSFVDDSHGSESARFHCAERSEMKQDLFPPGTRHSEFFDDRDSGDTARYRLVASTCHNRRARFRSAFVVSRVSQTSTQTNQQFT